MTPLKPDLVLSRLPPILKYLFLLFIIMSALNRNKKRPWINVEKKTDLFYQSKSWRNLRRAKIQASPLCEVCKRNGIITIGFICDHILPRRFFPELSMNINNLQTLCRSCDQRKRRIERGINSRDEFQKITREGGLRLNLSSSRYRTTISK